MTVNDLVYELQEMKIAGKGHLQVVVDYPLCDPKERCTERDWSTVEQVRLRVVAKANGERKDTIYLDWRR